MQVQNELGRAALMFVQHVGRKVPPLEIRVPKLLAPTRTQILSPSAHQPSVSGGGRMERRRAPSRRLLSCSRRASYRVDAYDSQAIGFAHAALCHDSARRLERDLRRKEKPIVRVRVEALQDSLQVAPVEMRIGID